MKPIFAVLLTCTMCLCGCSQKPYNKRTFIFDIHPPVVERSQSSGRTLTVKRFSINPAFASKSMVYRKGRFEYESDFYNVFMIAPADLISQCTSQWMAASGRFDSVNGASARDNIVLSANILGLYGDFSEKTRPKAVVSITFFLARDSDVLYHKTFTQATPLSTLNTEGLMAAYNDGLEIIFGQLETAIREVMTSLTTKHQ